MVKEMLSEEMDMKDREETKIMKSKATGKQSHRAMYNTHLMINWGLHE